MDVCMSKRVKRRTPAFLAAGEVASRFFVRENSSDFESISTY